MWLRCGLISCVLVVAAACAGPATPTSGTEPQPAASGAAGAEPAEETSDDHVVTYDEQLSQVARRFPGFSGFQVDEQRDRLLIYMTRQPPDVNALQAAIARTFRGDLAKLEPKVVIQRYSFEQLKRWYEAFGSAAFSFEGVTMTDINEVTNTIDIGVSDVPRARGPILEAARRQGIPRGVVRVVHQPAIEVD